MMIDLCPAPVCGAAAASPHVAPQRGAAALPQRRLAPVMLAMPQYTPDPKQGTPASRVWGLIAGGAGLYKTDGSESALAALISSQKSATPGTDTFGPAGQGTWEVYYAPHLNRLSSALGARISPIRYVLGPGSALAAHVRYSHPLLGEGWLSASGQLLPGGDAAVDIKFDRFWVDVGGGEEALRPELPAPGDPALSTGDRVVSALGRVSFVDNFARFPVLYLDDEGLAVFRFPPLASNIAVVRVEQ